MFPQMQQPQGFQPVPLFRAATVIANDIAADFAIHHELSATKEKLYTLNDEALADFARSVLLSDEHVVERVALELHKFGLNGKVEVSEAAIRIAVEAREGFAEIYKAVTAPQPPTAPPPGFAPQKPCNCGQRHQ